MFDLCVCITNIITPDPEFVCRPFVDYHYDRNCNTTNKSPIQFIDVLSLYIQTHKIHLYESKEYHSFHTPFVICDNIDNSQTGTAAVIVARVHRFIYMYMIWSSQINASQQNIIN